MTKLQTLFNISLTALAPIVWGSTYIVTTEALPADLPIYASVIRALGAGLILVMLFRTLPSGKWWFKIGVLGLLNIGLFFYCLFAAAYYLPGGIAALFLSTQPLFVIVLGALILKSKLNLTNLMSAVIGVLGIGLLVVNSAFDLNPMGVIFGFVGALSMALGIVLTKHWGRPEGMTVLGFTGWQLTLGGIALLPAAMMYEDFPSSLNLVNISGYVYLSIIGGAFGYFVWFRGIEKLNTITTSFLGFLSPVSASLLGYVVLGETFTHLQMLGALAIIVAIYLARPQPPKPQGVEDSVPATSSR
ncbi:EamA family transporter [Vibrio nigripulchritudo]|uniref:EamA family transporter n=1 Tax=Vibrio nigripulchritudo TaxID=28173 RepID=UPI0024933BD1|nr:EamA family transporter [Vibrio nigripulchritudo]BDU39345.1 ABC transporter permease [Vibrio nigripulchritudo]BDU45065.1 ABC transporter permease [Vibrio nigripulchritudo]